MHKNGLLKNLEELSFKQIIYNNLYHLTFTNNKQVKYFKIISFNLCKFLTNIKICLIFLIQLIILEIFD